MDSTGTDSTTPMLCKNGMFAFVELRRHVLEIAPGNLPPEIATVQSHSRLAIPHHNSQVVYLDLLHLWYTAKVIAPFLANWSFKTTLFSSLLAHAGALFCKPLKAITIYAKTSLTTFLCLLIVFSYFSFTVFNILASLK